MPEGDTVFRAAQTLHRFTAGHLVTRFEPNEKLWVYSRGGKPCRRRGAAIQSKKSGLDARVTYWRPRCQPMRVPEGSLDV